MTIVIYTSNDQVKEMYNLKTSQTDRRQCKYVDINSIQRSRDILKI